MDKGKRTTRKDTFATRWIITDSSPLTSFRRDVGVVSVSHVFIGADSINFLTFSDVTGDKHVTASQAGRLTTNLKCSWLKAGLGGLPDAIDFITGEFTQVVSEHFCSHAFMSGWVGTVPECNCCRIILRRKPRLCATCSTLERTNAPRDLCRTRMSAWRQSS